MRKIVPILVGTLLIAIGAFYYYLHRYDYEFSLNHLSAIGTIENITSHEFKDGTGIPQESTCDGSNVSPAISFTNVPTGAKSMAVLLEDSSTGIQPFTHWIVFNLSPDITTIYSSKVLDNADLGVNDYGKSEYDGPCPPVGQTHNYYFKVFALDTPLGIKNPNRAQFDEEIYGHVLATGSLSGLYSKNP